MRKAGLSEVLNECVTAVLDGRRTIDECLSLYPSLAPDLEPLLRTAINVSETLQTQSPPWNVQERIRHRVLAAHQARIRSRRLISGLGSTHSGPWRTRHWTLLSVAAAVILGAVILTSVLAGGSGGGDDGTVANPPLPVVEVERGVMDWRRTVREARTVFETLGYNRDYMEAVWRGAAQLSQQSGDPAAIEAADEETRLAVQDTISEVQQLLGTLPPGGPLAEEDEALLRNIESTNKVLAEQWGVPPPTDTPGAEETPAPESPSPTAPPPSPTPQPPSPTPTAGPTSTVTPAPTPPATATDPPSGDGE